MSGKDMEAKLIKEEQIIEEKQTEEREEAVEEKQIEAEERTAAEKLAAAQERIAAEKLIADKRLAAEEAEVKKYRQERLELMDALCRTGVALDAVSRMCSVLRLGFDSPEFCDGRDASACMWVLERVVDQIKAENIDKVLSE
ncbi:MAG: hypothetical protein Q4F21_01525 [Lachnospiraceae bacterium]|nr:hypothetical protein [Lachnospiraceae bacterium]